MNKKNIILWILFLLIFFFLSQQWNKKENLPASTNQLLSITPLKTQYASGEEVIVTVQNHTFAPITLPSNCPKNPFRVMVLVGEKFEERSKEGAIHCELSPPITLAPNEEKNVSYRYWNYALFGNLGRYKIEIPYNTGTTTAIITSPEFTVTEAGFWRKSFRTALYQPLYNILVFFIKIAPGRDLGFSIILLTMLIRIILLIPSQRAMVAQRRMQDLQPKLEKVKKQYAGQQERIAHETMKLWKEHKVNPFGSCLPLLIQFPILIALFYVIQNGLNPDNSHLVYSLLKNVDLGNIHTNFLGILELTTTNVFILPIFIGALQFFQMKLATVKNKKPVDGEKASEMETANKMMVYVMPVMIALFTASVPAGVGLYWGVSTLFGIGQQLIVNKNRPSAQ